MGLAVRALRSLLLQGVRRGICWKDEWSLWWWRWQRWLVLLLVFLFLVDGGVVGLGILGDAWKWLVGARAAVCEIVLNNLFSGNDQRFDHVVFDSLKAGNVGAHLIYPGVVEAKIAFPLLGFFNLLLSQRRGFFRVLADQSVVIATWIHAFAFAFMDLLQPIVELPLSFLHGLAALYFVELLQSFFGKIDFRFLVTLNFEEYLFVFVLSIVKKCANDLPKKICISDEVAFTTDEIDRFMEKQIKSAVLVKLRR